jgi:hypothetical protein
MTPRAKKCILRIYVIHVDSLTMRYFPGHDLEKDYSPINGEIMFLFDTMRR